MSSHVQYGTYGPVVTLENSGRLVKIRTSNDLEFWVKREKLKTVQPKKLKPAQVIPGVDSEEGAWERFVDYLNATGFCLCVHCKAAAVETVADEYAGWAGESLPDTCIKIYEKRLRTDRCWRLEFTLADGIKTPFPLELSGITNRRPTKHVRGLWFPNGKVHLYFTRPIESLVRAGLRAVPIE